MEDVSRNAKTLSEIYKIVAQSLGLALDDAADFINSILGKSQDMEREVVAKTLHPEVVNELRPLIERKKNPGKIIEVTDKEGNKSYAILYAKKKTNLINSLTTEALARSGLMPEMNRNQTTGFINNLKDNPMLEIKGMDREQYDKLLEDIQHLKHPINRITLFPNFYEQDGKQKVDVGFLEHTPERTMMKNGERETIDPYSTKDVIKTMLYKQILIEHSKENDIYQDLQDKKELFRKKEIDKAVNLERIKKDHKEILFVKKAVSELMIPDNEKKELLRLLKEAETSNHKRREFLTEINKKLTDVEVKNKIEAKIKSLSEVKYVVPVTIENEEKDLVISMEQDIFAEVGVSTNIHQDGKSSNTFMKAFDEVDYLSRVNQDDNRVVLILNENDFKKLRNKKKLNARDLERANNGEKELASLNAQLKDTKQINSNYVDMLNSHPEVFSISKSDKDGISIEAAVEELFNDNVGKFITKEINKEILNETWDEVEMNFPIVEARSNTYLDDLLEEMEEEARTENEGLFTRENMEQEKDNYYDRDNNYIDDRDQEILE